MPRQLLIGTVALVIFLMTVLPVRATTVIAPTFDELVAEATTIFRGEVIDVRSEWRDARPARTIVTLVTFRVETVIKGSQLLETSVEILGGTVGGATLKIAGTPQFRIGDRDILFVNDTGQSVSPIVGFMHGRFPVVQDWANGREFITTYDGRPLASSADIGQHALTQRGFPQAGAQTRPAERLLVGAFESQIRRKVQDQAVKVVTPGSQRR